MDHRTQTALIALLDLDVVRGCLATHADDGAATDVHRRCETAINGVEGLCRAIFEGGGAPRLIVDAESGGVVDANDAAELFYGYAPSALRAKAIWEIDARPSEELRASIAATANQGARRFATKHRVASGELRDVEVDLSPFVVGERRMLLATLIDVTARVQAEQALRHERGLFASLFELVPMGLCICDGDGCIVEANSTYCKLFGYRKDELVGRSFAVLVAPEDREAALAAYGVTAHGGPTPPVVRRRVRKDGAIVHVEARLTRFVDESGAPLVLVTVVDAAERLRVEALLRQSQERIELAAGVGKTGVWDWNVDTGELYLDGVFRRFLGYEDDEELGPEPWRRAVHPADHAQLHRAMTACARGDSEHYEEQLRMLRNDGTECWVLFRGTPVRGLGGVVLRVAGTYTDVTAMRRAQEENVQLEAQLREAQKMESLGQLAGGVAHDFNNLLTVILGYARIVERRLAPGDGLRLMVDQVIGAGERAKALTKQLLAISRKQILDVRALDVNQVIRDMDGILRQLVGESIELDFRLEPRLGVVHGDRAQLEQILLNLVVNARDAMPLGGVVTVATTNVSLDAEPSRGLAEGRYARITVADTGAGVDASIRPRIFDPFFTTKAHGKGTGLGLSMVQGIARQHGGDVVVDATVLRGAAFHVDFPHGPATRAMRPKSEPPSVRQRGKERVLLVEDDDGVRSLAEGILREHGYAVLAADDPAYALALLRAPDDRVDLLVTDVIMPHMSGVALCEKLRRARPMLRVLYMSGYTGEAIEQLGVHAGVMLLQKPFTAEELLASVRQVLDG